MVLRPLAYWTFRANSQGIGLLFRHFLFDCGSSFRFEHRNLIVLVAAVGFDSMLRSVGFLGSLIEFGIMATRMFLDVSSVTSNLAAVYYGF